MRTRNGANEDCRLYDALSSRGIRETGGVSLFYGSHSGQFFPYIYLLTCRIEAGTRFITANDLLRTPSAAS